MALAILSQNLRWIKPDSESSKIMSIVHGPLSPTLFEGTIGDLLHERTRTHRDHIAISAPWHGIKRTYADLERRSTHVAALLLQRGVQTGDIVAIMAGNRCEYIEVFLGAARLGIAVAVLNNTYTPDELKNALDRLACKALFIAPKIGGRTLDKHISLLHELNAKQGATPPAGNVILFDVYIDSPFPEYGVAVAQAELQLSKQALLRIQDIEGRVSSREMINVQFTSGTTGMPKAAMLTHRNIINNGALVGRRMHLNEKDVVCCSPPLFHCFGLVMGFLASFYHGATLIFPSDAFHAQASLDAIYKEGCTAVLGVPTMFLAKLDLAQKMSLRNNISSVRKGLVAGAAVPVSLLQRLKEELNWKGILNAYGMTETSPVSFMMSLDDMPHRREKGLGSVMPHTSAKIVDKDGNIVARNVRGELWTSGHNVMRGYLNNEKATKEVFVVDEADSSRIWMRTGDECVMDDDAYCAITGRIKDIIIRGGENIFPAEIEERLMQHKAVDEASVVGIADATYGEAVGCFLRQSVVAGRQRPDNQELQDWVRRNLGRHKAPKWIFWLGDQGVGDDFPKTGSGKHRKHVLKVIAENLIPQDVAVRAVL